MASQRGKISVLQSVARHVRGSLLSGLVVILPVWLTVEIVLAGFGAIEGTVRSLAPAAGSLDARFGILFWGTGLLVLAVATMMIGYVAKRAVGRQLIAYGERQVDRFPVIRSIYGALKQLVVTVFEKSDRSFQQSCLIEYPYRAKWAVSLIAGKAEGEIPWQTGEPDLVAVFMPTTPNPITGFLFYVPLKDIKPLDMSLEDAAKLIVSAGLVNPPRRRSTKPEGDGAE